MGWCSYDENISSAFLDLIEKKTLYHYKPGSFILSVGSFGCNFRCGFCQYHSISQNKPGTQFVGPEELIHFAFKKRTCPTCGYKINVVI